MPDLIAGLALDADPERSWLSALVRNGRRAAHPLQHLMLRAVLDDFAGAMVGLPFGSGPWPCRNPVAPHHGEAVIGSVRLRTDRGTVYGDFECPCGYLYTVSRAADRTIGAPRFRRFGPTLGPALSTEVARGDGLRRTAAMLGIDPKTLMREAAMAGVAVPWSTAMSGRMPSSRGPAPVVPAKAVGARARGKPSRNWFAIDDRLSRASRNAVGVLAAQKPPVRITFAEIERRVARSGWIAKRTTKLPRTLAAIAAAVEDTDGFRRRRLDHHVAMAVDSGDFRPCEVLRRAGLPMDWLSEVRDVLALARIRGRFAA